jgi:hypothetical protein
MPHKFSRHGNVTVVQVLYERDADPARPVNF